MSLHKPMDVYPSVSAGESRWKRWTIFLLIASIASVAAYHLGSVSALQLRKQGRQAPLPTINGLYIEPQSLDLGEVWETPRNRFRLTIRNIGRVARTVTRFQTTCGCLKLEPPGTTIAPGEAAEFSAQLDLMHRLPYQLGVARWAKSVRLDPVFEGDFAPTHGWELNCVVLSRVSLANASLSFGDRCTHKGPLITRKVRARVHVPLKSLEASAHPSSADVRVEAIADVPGDFHIFVSPHASLAIGPFQFEVEVRAVTMDDAVHPCMTIEASGQMQPSLRVIPRMVFLGECEVASQAEADVTLRLPAKDWKIDHIEADTDETRVTRSKAELEEGVRLHITQRIGRIGDHVAALRIVVCKPDKQLEIVPVKVHYHGESKPR
jgi:hypothetical protein